MESFELSIAMVPEEVSLFRSLITCARRYVEFGAGGSTCLAAELVADSVTSVDSSKQWLDKVASVSSLKGYQVQPVLVHANIGPLREWGYPLDQTHRDDWPAYHESIWERSGTSEADTFLIDGRFRVACCMQVMLRCHADAVLIIHDYGDRPYYADLSRVGREIARAANLSAFVRRHDCKSTTIQSILDEHRYDPQ